MPKKLTTLLLFIGALLAGGWVYWDLAQEPDKPSDIGPLFDDLPEENITRIRIIRPTSDATEKTETEQLTFEQKNNTWQMTEPESGPANANLIKAMLNNPTVSWPTAFVKVTEPEKLGLGENAIEVIFSSPEGEKTFRIGLRSKFQNGIYVKRKDAAKAALMDLDFSQPYSQPAQHYLAKGLKESTR